MGNNENNGERLTGKQVALLAIFGMAAFLSYADRTNIGIVIVPMGDQFDWMAKTKGTVLGAFFIGYICTQVVAGWLADGVFGGELVLLAGMTCWSLVLLTTPVMAQQGGLAGAIAARLLLGLAEGFVFPAIHSMLPKKIPSNWIAASSSFVSGMDLIGGMVAMLVSAPLAAQANWPSVFYLLGGLGVLWSVVWLVWLVVVDRQQLHSVTKKQTRRPIPWKTMLTSSSSWSYFTCGYCSSWGFWMIVSWLPSFFRDVFEADLEHLGNLAVLPYALQGIVGFLVGFLGDYALRHKLIGKRILRGSAQSVSMLGAAGLLIALLVTINNRSADRYQAVAMISAAMALNAFGAAGNSVNHFDLAPRFAGFLYGLGNSVSLIPGVIGVPLTGWMLEVSGWQWDGVFALAAVHYVVGLAVFLLFSSYSPIIP